MQKWTNSVSFPADSSYVCRVVEEAFGPSSKGNPMITLTPEIVSPETVEIAGVQYNIAGVQPAKMYFNVKTMDGEEVDVEKTQSNFERVFKSNDPEKKSLYELFELPTDTEGFDFENPTLGFKGKLFFCVITDKVKARLKAPTPAELEIAKKKSIHPSQAGSPMKNPVTGKDLITHTPTVGEIFGLAPSDGSKPY